MGAAPAFATGFFPGEVWNLRPVAMCEGVVPDARRGTPVERITHRGGVSETDDVPRMFAFG
jgi:hypothetical protein